MKKLAGILFLIFLFMLSSGSAANKKILVYTKNGKGYIHDNIAASVVALKKLGAANGMTVDVSDNSDVFTDENLKQYDCLVFSNTNNETFVRWRFCRNTFSLWFRKKLALVLGNAGREV
jgi:hypothetical protein